MSKETPTTDSNDPTPRHHKTREEYLACGTPFPPPEEVVIDDLTDEEADAFWTAINEA